MCALEVERERERSPNQTHRPATLRRVAEKVRDTVYNTAQREREGDRTDTERDVCVRERETETERAKPGAWGLGLNCEGPTPMREENPKWKDPTRAISGSLIHPFYGWA